MQLPLGISLPESAVFENFMEGDNPVAVGLGLALASGEGEQQVYLWGEQAVGKTHLLQACCAQAAKNGLLTSYLPMSDIISYGPEVLEGMEQMQLLCLDDIALIAGMAEWETALFNLINRTRQTACRLFLSASDNPAECGFKLPDLLSRLGWGPVVQLKPLNDDDKLAWLQQRALRQGLTLSDDIATYVLRHYPRDMHSLGQMLEVLDRASMAAKRRLTLPFVKSVLEQGSSE